MEDFIKPRMHRSHILYAPSNPGVAISIDEYIEGARDGITADAVRRVPFLKQQVEAKLQSDQAISHRDLCDGVKAIYRFLASAEAQNADDPLPRIVAEATVALNYFLKGFDLIPDSIPEIGLVDDARVIACVLARNPSIYQ